MTEPVTDDSTQQIYNQLPDVYRRDDVEQNWLLKKWLSGMGSQIDVIRTLHERFAYTPPEDGSGYRTSDLVDPTTADAEWLPWLAQLVGVHFDKTISVPDQRQAITDSILGIKAGSKNAIAKAASTVLVGSKEVKVFDHSDNVSIGSAGEWNICLLTKDTETLANALPVDQSVFASTNGWTSDSWWVNHIAGVAWTTTGMTASTGSTNPLLANYDTFSGSGNTYTPSVAIPGTKYEGSVRLRQTDGLAITADLVMEFMNGGSSITSTTVNVSGLNASWQKVSVSAVAPANTTHVRLKLVRGSAGVLQVTTKMVAAGSCGPYFDSGFTGAGTEDTTVTTLPLINYWRNGSFDVSGGHTTSNVNLTVTSERFTHGSTGGFVEVTGATPTIAPNISVPTYDGEKINASLNVCSYQPASQSRLEIRYTKADGTTTSVFGSWVDLSESEFLSVEVSNTTPADVKSCQIYVHFTATVGFRFYVDGGMHTRVDHNLGYFDGSRVGFTWNDGNHANAISIRNSVMPVDIVTETYVPDANALKVKVYATNKTVKVQMNPSRNPITVVAADPWTFMLSAYAYQVGNYYFVFQVVFYNNSNTETGRISKTYNVTTAMSPVDMVLQGVIPATTTRARMRLYIYGGQMGDYFGVTRGGARLGSVSGWIAVTADPVAAVIKAGAKPAGVILHTQQFSASWATIEAAYPTWADWEAAGTWQAIEETGL